MCYNIFLCHYLHLHIQQMLTHQSLKVIDVSENEIVMQNFVELSLSFQFLDNKIVKLIEKIHIMNQLLISLIIDVNILQLNCINLIWYSSNEKSALHVNNQWILIYLYNSCFDEIKKNNLNFHLSSWDSSNSDELMQESVS